MTKSKILAAAALAFFCIASVPAAAQAVSTDRIKSIDVSKLSPDQKAQLLSSVTQMQQQPQSGVTISESVRTEAGKWGELGTNMGRAAVSAAREVGVAANEFIQTPIGKITMAIIVYKIVGQELIEIVAGGFILMFFLGVALYLVLRKKYENVEYDHKPVLWGLWQKKVVTNFEVDSDSVAYHLLGAAVSTAIGLIVGLNIMF